MTRPCGYFDGHSREECGEPAAYLYVSPDATVVRARCQAHATVEERLPGWRLVPVGDPWPGPVGMYYTPAHIVDPAGGSGSFLADAADVLTPVNPPYGGTDETS